MVIETPFFNCVVGLVPDGMDSNYERGSINADFVSAIDVTPSDEVNPRHFEAKMAGIYKKYKNVQLKPTMKLNSKN